MTRRDILGNAGSHLFSKCVYRDLVGGGGGLESKTIQRAINMPSPRTAPIDILCKFPQFQMAHFCLGFPENSAGVLRGKKHKRKFPFSLSLSHISWGKTTLSQPFYFATLPDNCSTSTTLFFFISSLFTARRHFP